MPAYNGSNAEGYQRDVRIAAESIVLDPGDHDLELELAASMLSSDYQWNVEDCRADISAAVNSMAQECGFCGTPEIADRPVTMGADEYVSTCGCVYVTDRATGTNPMVWSCKAHFELLQACKPDAVHDWMTVQYFVQALGLEASK